MVSLGMGLLGGAATGAASSGLAGGLTSGLANGSINGLTGFGKALEGVQSIGKMLGGGGGGGAPGGAAQGGQVQYGSNNGDALAGYVMQLLNQGKGGVK
ncbi:hypothetical protein [Ochrobactrum chromiisoli]|uniref:Uncharacterized protein n=1 Tax=Ochrobactrum chromiisoli TaxID=2993941 RepID=A0ABT3QUI9_9HYPH|nr:hypothetical protein [Ochrobactrum chromiisoli]MCX2699286.1 hypothetical protein [Ochrobactrum chromiisoli]